MSTHYILVTVYTADDVTDKAIIDEILSDLSSCEGDLSIQAESTAVVLPNIKSPSLWEGLGGGYEQPPKGA